MTMLGAKKLRAQRDPRPLKLTQGQKRAQRERERLAFFADGKPVEHSYEPRRKDWLP